MKLMLIFFLGVFVGNLMYGPKAHDRGFAAGKFTREVIFRLPPLDYKDEDDG